MEGFAEYKVPEGKLVSAKVAYSEKIYSVQILGDFFIHPEESLSEIEQALIGLSPGEEEDTIAEKIRAVIASKGIEMIGVTPEAIAKVVRMAIG
ncbi:MAG: biotin--protein ligase [Candidatus Micrarchaeota archaeon]|nr:biotin--protein ligase [Candidatus Micrarchaeota archaeon]